MNAFTQPRPVAETDDTVTITRRDFDALIEALEDAQDVAAVLEARRAHEAGESEALPIELCERLWAGEHPVRIWREHRGLTQVELAEKATVNRAYLAEIETGKKPGTAVALKKLAAALKVSLDELVPDRED